MLLFSGRGVGGVLVGQGSDWRRCNAQGMVARKRVGEKHVNNEVTFLEYKRVGTEDRRRQVNEFINKEKVDFVGL
jgi:hypothetical protein